MYNKPFPFSLYGRRSILHSIKLIWFLNLTFVMCAALLFINRCETIQQSNIFWLIEPFIVCLIVNRTKNFNVIHVLVSITMKQWMAFFPSFCWPFILHSQWNTFAVQIPLLSLCVSIKKREIKQIGKFVFLFFGMCSCVGKV